MKITREPFGVTEDGKEVFQFRLENNAGASVTVMNYGCTITSILVPDREGRLTDICLGYPTLAEYEKNDGYLGAVVGRHANRIERGVFVLDGKEYRLAVNNGPNHLHGGLRGFDKRVWEYTVEDGRLVFGRRSPDGEEGYPGNLDVSMSYQLTDDNELILRYEAETDADTVVNLTNHCYFNLSGEGKGTILNHVLQIPAVRFTENDENCLPTGKILEVDGTPFDFRQPKEVGRDIHADCVQLKNGLGYDHNFILDGAEKENTAAVLYAPDTGIAMTVTTTMPGVQFYSGNVLDGPVGKSGVAYEKNMGLCLETQYFPNALRCTNFPSPVLKKGERYDHMTKLCFAVKG